MKIITPRWKCQLVPAVEVVKLNEDPLPLWGLWALPGGQSVGTLELRSLCRQRNWQLVETEFRQARTLVKHEWTPSAGRSSLENTYCVPGLSRYT